MKKCAWIAVGLVSIFLTGCGGGSGGGIASTPPPDTGAPFSMGNFEGRGAASNPPVTTAGQQTVATGVTGNFSLLRLRDQNVDLGDSRIAMATRKTTGGDIYTTNIDGSNLFRVTATTNIGEEEPAWNPGGTKIAFQGFDNSFFRDIYIYRADGLFLTRVTNTPAAEEENPDWSPDGTKLIFDRSGTLIVFNTANSQETPLDTGGNASNPAWSSTNKLAFVTTRNGNNDIYVSNADGSSPSPSLGTSPDPDTMPVWSPDGETLFYMKHSASGYEIIRYQQSFWIGQSTSIFTSDDPILALDVSPDGQFVAFQTVNGIFEVPQHGGSATLMFDPVDHVDGFSWGPMLTDRLFVGSGGLFSAGAAGFIFGDSSSRTQSFLAFDCVTRSSALLRAQTGIGGTEDSLQFFLDGDSVNMLKFANAPDWTVATPVGSGTAVPTANGALISIDAFTGKVNAVLPFVGSRGVDSKPTISRQGSNYVYTGNFISAVDASGKNIAPTGASRVILDPKTGSLTAG